MELQKVKRKTTVFMIFAIMISVLAIWTIVPTEAQAANKKSTYVILTTKDIWTKETISKIQYNKHGLIQSIYHYTNGRKSQKIKFSYDKKKRITKIVSMPLHGGSHGYTCRYYYRKNGKVNKALDEGNYEYHCIYKKGKITKVKEYEAVAGKPYTGYATIAYNKKGLPKKVVSHADTIRSAQYTYDKKKNVKKDNAFIYANSYSSKGRLIERFSTNRYSTTVRGVKYQYKNIKIKKKYSSKIAKQQWALRHEGVGGGAIPMFPFVAP